MVDWLDRLDRLGLAVRDRQRRAFDRNVRPMRLPLRPLRDPVPEQTNLRLGQALARFRRRHPVILILSHDQFEQFAVFGIAPNNRGIAGFEFGQGPFLLIKTQARFAFGFVGSVTGITILREDRADIAIETDGRARLRRRSLRLAQRLFQRSPLDEGQSGQPHNSKINESSRAHCMASLPDRVT